MQGDPTKSAAAVQTVGRALDILLCFGAERSELSATELAGLLGLHKSTVHRIASFLVARGFLSQDPASAKYRLGLKLAELGSLALRQMDLQGIARPHLEQLMRRTGETVVLAIRDDDAAVYIDVVESNRPIILTAYPGHRVALHASGTGKALLAYLSEPEIDRIIRSVGLPRLTSATVTEPTALLQHLAEIRTRGYSTDNEETQEGSAGIAAPVWDGTGRVIAAVGSPVAPSILNRRLPEIVAEVQETASAISSTLGY